MNKICVIGGGGHAKVVISILKKINKYEIIGYTDKKNRGEILQIRYLGTDTIMKNLIRENPDLAAIIGLGNIKLNKTRELLFEKLENFGFELPSIISPFAIINEDVLVGKGTLICDGVIVNSGTRIGKGVILNTSCSVDHDCKIGDFVHIAPGVTLSGGVSIGNNSLIGTGASVIQYKNICEDILIGAGTVVLDNIMEPGIYVGNPARKVK